MENNQSPFEQWQRPDGLAGSTPSDASAITGSAAVPPPPPAVPGTTPALPNSASGAGFSSPPTGEPAASLAPPNPHVSYYSTDFPNGATNDSAALGSAASAPDIEPNKKSRAPLIAVTAAVVALGAGGVFFISSSRNPGAGGAASPDELGAQFLDAVENEDLLGVVDTLVPGEREVYRQPLIDYVNELTRLQILGPTNLSSLNGIQINISNSNVAVEPTNVSDITNLHLTGTVELSANVDELPMGKIIKDNVPQEQLDQMSQETTTQTTPLDLTITSVEQDGQWYFSLGYTAAESVRKQMGSPEIPQTGLAPVGGETPEEAFNEVLNAASEMNLSGLIQSLNPGEAAALQRYAPLFITDAQSGLDQARGDADFAFEFTTPVLHSTVNGDVATTFVDEIGLKGTADNSPFEFQFDGNCVTGTFNGEAINQCTNKFDSKEMSQAFKNFPELEKFVNDLSAAFSDMQPVGVEFRRTAGKWFLSPVSTGNAYTLTVLRALDATEVQTLIDDATAMAQSFTDRMTGALNDMNLQPGELPSLPATEGPGSETLSGESADTSSSTTSGTASSDDSASSGDSAPPATTAPAESVPAPTVPIDVTTDG